MCLFHQSVSECVDLVGGVGGGGSSGSSMWTSERTGDTLTFLCPLAPLSLSLLSVQLFSFLSLTFHVPTFIHSFIFFPSPTLPCFLFPLSSLTQIFSILSIADITEKNSLVDPALVSVVFGVELCVYVVPSWAEQDSCP